mmetsp:Transcript_17066/g.34542  ORF Transcript_17066/g.34542 Transcript_17066/m.34542 type:complete len:327 (+) Transcript_17066:43-1023(+)
MATPASQESARRAASALPLALSPSELALATEELYHLLRSLPTVLLRQGPELDHALRRYETVWLPLIASSLDDGTLLVPPPDVAWVWLVHLLAPERYTEDTTKLVGKVLRRPTSALQRGKIARTAGIERAKRGLLYSDEEYAHSTAAWTAHCKTEEPYFLQWVATPPQMAAAPPPESEAPWISQMGYDIVAAVERQQVFNYQVSLPHFVEPVFLERAVQRYKQLLLLKQRNPDRFLVPCYDNDLVWHAHQLQPGYESDTVALHGKLLNHDDSVNDRTAGSKLARTSDTTRRLWSDTFGEAFEAPGAMFRGQPPYRTQSTPTTSLMSP